MPTCWSSLAALLATTALASGDQDFSFASRGLAEALGGMKCGQQFQCPDGAAPQQNPAFDVTPNGCGTDSFRLKTKCEF